MELAGQIAEDDAMLGRRRGVRDDRAADQLVTPRATKIGLVGPQERVGVEERAVACRCVHAATLSRPGRICHDPPGPSYSAAVTGACAPRNLCTWRNASAVCSLVSFHG